MSGDAVFRTSTKSAPPTRQEASATCRGQIEAAVTLALSANVHRIDCADLYQIPLIKTRGPIGAIRWT